MIGSCIKHIYKWLCFFKLLILHKLLSEILNQSPKSITSNQSPQISNMVKRKARSSRINLVKRNKTEETVLTRKKARRSTKIDVTKLNKTEEGYKKVAMKSKTRSKMDLSELNLDRTYSAEDCELINNHVKTDPVEIEGQLINHFILENGKLIPIPQNPIALEAAIQEISRQLGNWNTQACKNGIVTTSRGGFNFGVSGMRHMIRAPSVAFTPEKICYSLSDDQLWSFQSDPFTPILVVEVANITSDSQFDDLDDKFKKVYFAQGTSVKLGWLIDPKNHDIWIYRYNKNNAVYRRKQSSGWKDLDGGDILEKFTLDVLMIDHAIPQESESDEEDEDEGDVRDEGGDPCTYCEATFKETYDLIKHLEQNHVTSKKI